MELSERLKEVRERKGFSQTDLAIKAGYTANSIISAFERGKRTISDKTVQRLASALEVSPDEFYKDLSETDLESASPALKVEKAQMKGTQLHLNVMVPIPQICELEVYRQAVVTKRQYLRDSMIVDSDLFPLVEDAFAVRIKKSELKKIPSRCILICNPWDEEVEILKDGLVLFGQKGLWLPGQYKVDRQVVATDTEEFRVGSLLMGGIIVGYIKNQKL